jgi:hypothetical protein
MESEKAFRRYLKASGSDTDDREFDDAFDEDEAAAGANKKKFKMPASFKLFKKSSSKKNN